MQCQQLWNAGMGKSFLSASARFTAPHSCAILTAPIVTDSRTLWYVTMLCFFWRVDCGMVEMVTMLLLSQKTLLGPLIGMPIILIL